MRLTPHRTIWSNALNTSAARSKRHNPALRGWHATFGAPLVIVLLATTILPFVYSVSLGLSSSNKRLAPEGALTLGHFEQVLSSSTTWHALLLAAIFLLVAVSCELILGIVIALLLDKYLPRSSLVRVLILWPAVLPPIAVALVFKFLLHGEGGLISYYLGFVGIHQEWLTDPVSALIVIIAIDVWEYTPFAILLTLAALKTLPGEVLEAGQIDGAGGIRTAWHIMLPMVRPALISVALLRFIDAVQVFPTIYVLTRGGPGDATQLITYYNFQAFFGQLRFGEGAAIAVIVVLFTLACVAGFLQLQKLVERGDR